MSTVHVDKEVGADNRIDTYSDGGLQRGLKNRHVQMIALGGIIGSAFFLGTGNVVGSVGPGAFLAYALGGLIVYLVMISLGELAVAIPISGSFITYASEFISPSWAAGIGWNYVVTWVTYIPAECTAAGILMNAFIPSINPYIWAVGFGLIITLINISNVKNFGEMEFWLAIIKVGAIILFCALGILIFLGVIHGDQPGGIIGFKYFTQNGGFLPKGTWILFSTMIMLLVNFQGSEIIGLSAGETQDPSKSIPIAIRNVTYRIILLFIVPVLILVTIFPWDRAGLSESVFAAALNFYGLRWAAGLFSFVVLTAAISCANSGLYATVRAAHALAQEGMAPKFLAKINKNAVPGNATIFVIGLVWLFLAGSYFFSASSVFLALLSISGFSGAVAWISICWSQYNFRRRLYKAGYTAKDLKYAAPGFPYLTQLGIWLQVGILVFTAFNEDLRIGFYAGVPILLIPIIIHKLLRAERNKVLEKQQRIEFDHIFKPKSTNTNKY